MIKTELVMAVTKEKRKYKILTDKNEYLFSEDTILKYLIFKDKAITEAQLKEAILFETKLGIFNKCLNFLSYSMRSINEVRLYLSKQTEDYSIIEEVISRLTNLGYLNDDAYANYQKDFYIRSLKGPKRLEQLLKTNKIEDSIIREVVEKYNFDIEFDILQKKLLKIKDKYIKDPIIKQKQKIQNKLLRDGFNSYTINSVLKETEFANESRESLNKDISKLSRKYGELSSKDKKSKIIKNLMTKGYTYSDILEALVSDEVMFE